MVLPSLLARLIHWLREGYPDGVPDRDYLPLFALLSRRLSPAELAEVVADLQQSGQLTGGPEDATAAVRRAVEAVTNSPPSGTEVARVQRYLETLGGDFQSLEGV